MDIEKFRKIFEGLEERFGYHIADYEEGNGKKSGVSRTSDYPHTIKMWEAHLKGEKFDVIVKGRTIKADSLGLCPIINKENKCWWGAIDLDNYKPDLKELFKKLKSCWWFLGKGLFFLDQASGININFAKGAG